MAVNAEAGTYSRGEEDAIRDAVQRIVADTPITDMHTHLYAPAFGGLLLSGIDELLTYHYLIAEALRVSKVQPDEFYELGKEQQAELIWEELFVERSPISEACRGVLTVLDLLGLDVASRDLDSYREHFAQRDIHTHIGTVFEKANLSRVVMTNDPFDDEERAVWESGYEGDTRFHAALRIDPLINDLPGMAPKLKEWGFDVHGDFDAASQKEVRRFLCEWLRRMNALYMAVSLPPDFTYPDDSLRSQVITECVLPVAQAHGVPFAMMIGVKRGVNPALKLAGDGVGKADIEAVERLCADFPDNKFMVTMLSRENQHELCVAARKFPNLLIFGCWWFLNNPSLINEMTRMRTELLGLSMVPQHSDARVLEQVVYKWEHSRAIISDVLADKYCDLAQTGWLIREDEIAHDAERLFGGVFWDFVKA